MAQTTVPTVPTFADGDHSVTAINNLSQCVRFLVGDIYPQWHSFKTASSSISSATTWTDVPIGTVAYDSESSGAGNTGILTDGIGAIIRTQGIYMTEACVGIVSTSTAVYNQISFLITGGGNNPHLTTGATRRYGLRGNESVGVAGAEQYTCCVDSTPFAVYPLDKIRVQASCGVATTITFNNNSAYNNGRFSTNFTGRWKMVGS